MSKTPKRLAIIPARGGSKRIPQKNIALFHGQPIISYTLNAAKESGLFDLIHVSTESKLIYGVVRGLGYKPDFLRPVELAGDDAPLLPVLKYVVEQFAKSGNLFDEVWLLMPCAPLLTMEDLVRASKCFDSNGGPILSICEYPAPIEWAYEKDSYGRLSSTMRDKVHVRSQDLGMKYYDAGLFAAYAHEDLMNQSKTGDNFHFYGVNIDRLRAVDIDNEADWVYAEKVYELLKA